MLVEREAEFTRLHDLIQSNLKGKKPLSVYISGSPGTGKTATVKAVISELRKKSKFHAIFINCMAVNKKPDVELAVLRGLGVTPASRYAVSKELLNQFATTKSKIVLILDEVDNLLGRRSTLLYTAFGWPAVSDGNVIVLGIANSIDLTERLLPKLREKGYQPSTHIFEPYNKDQIISIIKAMFADHAELDAKSIEFCAKKVASQTGDIRAAINIAERTIFDMQEDDDRVSPDENAALPSSVTTSFSTPKKNSLRATINVVNSVNSSPLVKTTLPEHSRILLATLIKLVSTRPKTKKITKADLLTGYGKVSRELSITPATGEDLIQAIDVLETCGMITFQPARPHMRIILDEDIGFAREKVANAAWIAKIDEMDL